MSPRVTVLMPVHNGSKFLKEAIDSVLGQTFADFELLIIDDGSTDNSVEIIAAIEDFRIRLIRNETNLGVCKTLNRGIALARGDFIARMDADDISLPQRIERQLRILEQNPDIAVLAARIVLIDAVGRELKTPWAADCSTTTHDEIRRWLPRSNCIAHPSVMLRRSIAVRYGYRENQLHAEDYDLWLRLSADGLKIEKIMDPLLQYRVHAQSVTCVSNATGRGIKNVATKSRFLLHRLISRQRLNSFDLRVAGSLARDFVKMTGRKIDSFLRQAAIRLLMGMGRLASFFVPKRHGSSLYFIFPFYHVGGAERVHSDIIAAVAEGRPRVLITNSSKSCAHKEDMKRHGRLWDISFFLKNVIGKHICLGFVASLINSQSTPRVFGSNSLFFYELIPFLGAHVECTDLLHAFGGGLEEVSLPHVHRLNRRVVICEKTFADLKAQYASHNFGQDFLQRISIIGNAVDIPVTFVEKKREKELRVLYVGRGSAEKRVFLVGIIAERCHLQEVPARFTLVGDVVSAIAPLYREQCTLVGECSEVHKLEGYYQQSDILLVTSSREGFPLVVMEAMAQGVVPVCTAVGGIPEHIVHGVNGFLVTNAADNDKLVGDFCEVISSLVHDRKRLEEMSMCAYKYAAKHFSRERFVHDYQALLLNKVTE